MSPISDDELSRLLAQPPAVQLPPDFTAKTSRRMLAIHRRRSNRRLYAQFAAFGLLSLLLVFGLGLLFSKQAAGSLLQTLLEFKWVFAFGALCVVGVNILDARLLDTRTADHPRVPHPPRASRASHG